MQRKWWFIVAGLAALGGAATIAVRLAFAGVTCTLPFNLQNNTTADANQVMANYNALVTCLTQAAHAGTNSDITALNSLSTPIPPSSGGTFTFIGSTSGGVANAQTTTTTPAGFALTTGYRVGFVAGSTNTGAMTLNVNSTGAKNVFRNTNQGLVATAGGEVVAGTYTEAVYDGTEYIVMGPMAMVGEIRDWAGSSGAAAPPGYLFANGGCVSRTTYATLFAVAGTTYDPGAVCAGTDFALPDLRGRLTAGKDDQGGSAANRLTNALSSCTGTTLGGAGCGTQAASLTQAHVPQLPVSDPGHIHILANGGNPLSDSGAGGSVAATGASFPSSAIASHTTGISVNATNTQVAYPVVNPLQIVYKIVKF